MKILHQIYTCDAKQTVLAHLIEDLFHDHCWHFELMLITDLNLIACNLHLQCPSDCLWYGFLGSILELCHGPYLFLLLYLPPTNLLNVVHGQPCQSDCITGNVTFLCQILSLYAIIHILINLHVVILSMRFLSLASSLEGMYLCIPSRTIYQYQLYYIVFYGRNGVLWAGEAAAAAAAMAYSYK